MASEMNPDASHATPDARTFALNPIASSSEWHGNKTENNQAANGSGASATDPTELY
jgi:hypothetical protein